MKHRRIKPTTKARPLNLVKISNATLGASDTIGRTHKTVERVYKVLSRAGSEFRRPTEEISRALNKMGEAMDSLDTVTTHLKNLE